MGQQTPAVERIQMAMNRFPTVFGVFVPQKALEDIRRCDGQERRLKNPQPGEQVPQGLRQAGRAGCDGGLQAAVTVISWLIAIFSSRQAFFQLSQQRLHRQAGIVLKGQPEKAQRQGVPGQSAAQGPGLFQGDPPAAFLRGLAEEGCALLGREPTQG